VVTILECFHHQHQLTIGVEIVGGSNITGLSITGRCAPPNSLSCLKCSSSRSASVCVRRPEREFVVRDAERQEEYIASRNPKKTPERKETVMGM
jgi:hypothetical protein